MNKKLSIFLLCGLSLQIVSSDPGFQELLKMEGIFQEADVRLQNTHSQKRDKALSLNKKRTQKRKEARDDKAFRQDYFVKGHPLEVAYLQRVSTKSVHGKKETFQDNFDQNSK